VRRIAVDPWTSRRWLDIARDPAFLANAAERHDPSLDVFNELIEQVRRQLLKLGVLKKLHSQQQMKLAALVIDLREKFEQSTVVAREYLRRDKARSRSGPGQLRRIAQRDRRIQRDLRAQRKALEKLDPVLARYGGNRDRIAHIDAALREIGLAEIPSERAAADVADWYNRLRTHHPEPDDPRGKATEQLVHYFHDEIGLRVTDARVRTARIGNALWAWNLVISRTDSGTKDCAAIRMLIRRRTRARGARQKK
jgi:hypothetical protein